MNSLAITIEIKPFIDIDGFFIKFFKYTIVYLNFR